MSFEELPLFKNSLKVLKFCSLLLRHDWRRYVCLVPTIVLNACQFVEFFTTNASLDASIRIAYDMVLWFIAIARAISIVYYRYRYEKFMKDMTKAYKEIEKDEDMEIIQLLAQTRKESKTVEIMNFFVGITAVLAISLYPLFTIARDHPFVMYIPWFDKNKSPLFEIIYIYQCYVTTAGFCMFMPFMNIFLASLMFGICMCKVLQHHLRNLKNLRAKEVWPEIVWCVRYQNQIIRYVDSINSLTTYVYMSEFLSFGPLMCVLLFQLNIVRTAAQVMVLSTYIVMIFSQVATMFWFANELSEQSVALATAAYESNWFDFDLKSRKALILFIARAQKPCSILVGATFPMTLSMFQSMLNVTYSYFTLLRQAYG